MRLSKLPVLVFAVALLSPLSKVQAQDAPMIQALSGSLAPGEIDVFLMQGLKAGQVVSAFIGTTSGNLDPILSVTPADENLPAKVESYRQAVTDLLATSPNPLLDLPSLRDDVFLAWET
jgi:hypothetical protein